MQEIPGLIHPDKPLPKALTRKQFKGSGGESKGALGADTRVHQPVCSRDNEPSRRHFHTTKVVRQKRANYSAKG